MAMTTERKKDPVKEFATVMVYTPALVLRTGFAFLRMKRRLRKSARRFRKGLIARGMTPEQAHRLSESYAGDLSIRKMVRGLIGSDRGE